jgi:hypothetical protein
MTLELRKEIESELTKAYRHLGFTDKSVIKRKINGQFKMLTVTQPIMITLIDGHELIGKPLFIAVDKNVKPYLINRDGEIYSKQQETWIVLFVTEAHAHLTIETLDHLHPLQPTTANGILENGEWRKIVITEIDNNRHNWLTLY